MMRGQAFSTFKLMIAAVVAVAILGILLSILGGIQSPMGFEQQAKNLLSEVSASPGTAKKGPSATLTPGIYSLSNLQAAASGTLHVKCNRGQCGYTGDPDSDSWFTSDDGSLKVSSKLTAVSLAACCTSTGGDCYLGIGMDVDTVYDNKCK